MTPSPSSYCNVKCKLGASHRMLASRCLCAFIFVSLLSNPASAKGSGIHSEDRYNPQHIDSLPPEIRKAIFHMCSTPRAAGTKGPRRWISALLVPCKCNDLDPGDRWVDIGKAVGEATGC